MKRYILLVVLLVSAMGYTQNGINYKALIKDDSGNVIADNSIQIKFKILESDVQTNVYEETHTPTTDSNGIIIVNIGEGNIISGIFNDINWGDDTHFLNVKINTGGGFVDLGTTQFSAVPYAFHAKKAANVNGLEAIDEGNGIGWRLIGRNADNYDNIGFNAMDLSFVDDPNLGLGATGRYAFSLGHNGTASGAYALAFGNQNYALNDYAIAFGNNNIVSGLNSTAIGGINQVSGDYAFAAGLQNVASSNYSIALGVNAIASGEYAIALGSTISESYASTAIGRYNVGGGDPINWSNNDPVFEIGNGSSDSERNNALTVFKNGRHVINSSSSSLIINSGGTGIQINNPRFTGVDIRNPRRNGVTVATATDYGAYIRGYSAGIHAEAGYNPNPDIILGGTFDSEDGDDGILVSDPEYTSSDIILKSNDAVVVELDDDNNESGHFIIRNGINNTIFQVNEQGQVLVDNSLVHSSDRRLKTNIENLDYGLKEILQLQPKQYFWKNQQLDKKSLGLIAQDVKTIISEIVTTQDDELKTLSISYTELIPVLINAIKEQQKIIEKQNSNNTSLLERVSALETHLSN